MRIIQPTRSLAMGASIQQHRFESKVKFYLNYKGEPYYKPNASSRTLVAVFNIKSIKLRS